MSEIRLAKLGFSFIVEAHPPLEELDDYAINENGIVANHCYRTSHGTQMIWFRRSNKGILLDAEFQRYVFDMTEQLLEATIDFEIRELPGGNNTLFPELLT